MGLDCEAVNVFVTEISAGHDYSSTKNFFKNTWYIFGIFLDSRSLQREQGSDVFLTKYCSCSKNACCGIKPHLLSSWQPRVLPINHKGKGHEIAAIHSQTPYRLVCPLRSSCTNPSRSIHSRVLWWSVEIYCFVSTWPWPLHFFGHRFLMFPRTPFNDLERGSMNVLLSIKCRFMDKEI